MIKNEWEKIKNNWKVFQMKEKKIFFLFNGKTQKFDYFVLFDRIEIRMKYMRNRLFIWTRIIITGESFRAFRNPKKQLINSTFRLLAQLFFSTFRFGDQFFLNKPTGHSGSLTKNQSKVANK